MRRAPLFASLLILLLLFGCTDTIRNEETACDAQHTATPCTNAALWYSIMHKDVTSALSMCAKIDTSAGDAFIGSGKDRCYMEVARAQQDASICNNIDSLNTVTRGLCMDRAKPPRQSTFCLPALVLPLFSLLLFAYRKN